MEHTLTVYPTPDKLEALKAFLKALKIKFEEAEQAYDPEFVAKIEESRQQIKEGKGVKMKPEDLWK